MNRFATSLKRGVNERAGATLNTKPRAANNAGLHQNFPEPLKNSPSCLADCFTWPQVALTHHVLSTAIETSVSAPCQRERSLPDVTNIQYKTRQFRITGDDVGILKHFGLPCGPVDVKTFSEWID